MPTTLRLSDAITAPTWVQVDFSRVCFLRNCLREPRFPTGSFDLQVIQRKESSKCLLDQLPPWDAQQPLRLHFYTDGSADQMNTAAASAVLLLVQTDTGWHFGGYHTFTPIQSKTAQAAEHSAIFGAILWSLHIVHQHACCPLVTIHYDCFAAGRAAAGHWNSHIHNLPNITRALVLWVEQIVAPIQWQHTPAHADIPGNEAVDTLSRQAWQTGKLTCELHNVWNLCTFDGRIEWAIEWLWFIERTIRHPHALMPFHNQTMWFNVQAPFIDSPQDDLQALARKQPHLVLQYTRLIVELPLQICSHFFLVNVAAVTFLVHVRKACFANFMMHI